jgi:Fe-S cluster assembly ATP-binding protein
VLHCNAISLIRSEKHIFNNLNLILHPGSTVALIGPNGSGKSSFALGIMGHPQIQLQGEILYNGQPILNLPAEKRARLGIFVSFQHPLELPGVSVRTFLREAQRACDIELKLEDFDAQLALFLDMVGLPRLYADRYYNVGFSGGERKRTELLSMLMLNPSLVILDEIDSGLDAQGITCLKNALQFWREKNPQGILIVISHYDAFMKQLKIDTTITFGK